LNAWDSKAVVLTVAGTGIWSPVRSDLKKSFLLRLNRRSQVSQTSLRILLDQARHSRPHLTPHRFPRFSPISGAASRHSTRQLQAPSACRRARSCLLWASIFSDASVGGNL